MKSLKESIVKSNDAGIVSVSKALADKLQKSAGSKRVKNGKKYDGIGQELYEGDIVMIRHFLNFGVILKLNPYDKYAYTITVYNASTKTEEDISVFDVFKLQDPKKYLK